MRSVSKRAIGLSVKREAGSIGGPVIRKRRISGRGNACGAFIRAIWAASECVLVMGSVSTVNVEDTAQSSQDVQYFSGVCVTASLDSVFSTVWQGGAAASVIWTE